MTANTESNDLHQDRNGALLSIAELAAYLGVPIATIYQWRHHHRGPTGYRVGRHVRYRASDIEHWLETQRDPHERT
jgi:excisionase family DNA binding protein